MGVIAEAIGSVASFTPHGMLGTNRIPEDVLHALFPGQTTNYDIHVHQAQPKAGSGDAFGYALADILDNCTKLGRRTCVLQVHLVLPMKHGNVRNYIARQYYGDVGKDAQELPGFVGVLKQHHKKKAGIIIKHNANAVENPAATQAFPGNNVDGGSSPEPRSFGQE
eukprot:jgi/Tetstr1/442160/TSEL_030312.t1